MRARPGDTTVGPPEEASLISSPLVEPSICTPASREEHLPHSVSVRWMNWTQIDPSPTADATRLTLFDRWFPSQSGPTTAIAGSNAKRVGGDPPIRTLPWRPASAVWL